VRDEPLAGTVEVAARGRWAEYLKPLRFDHWIKNAVVPVGSLLAILAHRLAVDLETAVDIGLAFLISGAISSVNYAINEVLDAPFDARHPTKRFRPIPSGRVRVGPLIVLAAGLGVLALAKSA
jgi:4-hydroxybenzoate polyprenyltransferase